MKKQNILLVDNIQDYMEVENFYDDLHHLSKKELRKLIYEFWLDLRISGKNRLENDNCDAYGAALVTQSNKLRNLAYKVNNEKLKKL